MDQTELKREFARALLLTPDDPYKAAFATIRDDSGLALQVATQWARDPVVVEEMQRILGGEGEIVGILPTKERQALDIYKIAIADSIDPEVALKAHRLYAEIMGHIAEAKGGVTNILNQGVMIVKDYGDDTSWEEKAIINQRRLIEGNHATN